MDAAGPDDFATEYSEAEAVLQAELARIDADEQEGLDKVGVVLAAGRPLSRRGSGDVREVSVVGGDAREPGDAGIQGQAQGGEPGLTTPASSPRSRRARDSRLLADDGHLAPEDQRLEPDLSGHPLPAAPVLEALLAYAAGAKIREVGGRGKPLSYRAARRVFTRGLQAAPFGGIGPGACPGRRPGTGSSKQGRGTRRRCSSNVSDPV